MAQPVELMDVDMKQEPHAWPPRCNEILINYKNYYQGMAMFINQLHIEGPDYIVTDEIPKKTKQPKKTTIYPDPAGVYIIVFVRLF